jgi:hypothetical protein
MSVRKKNHFAKAEMRQALCIYGDKCVRHNLMTRGGLSEIIMQMSAIIISFWTLKLVLRLRLRGFLQFCRINFY